MRVIAKNATKHLSILVTAAVIAVSGSAAVLAADDTDFTQVINAGTLSTGIFDASRNPVANPAVQMNTQTFSFDCQTSTSVNPFGTSTERIYAVNPDAADNGWTLTVAAASTSALWSNTGATQTYDFNDATGSGCTDGPDSGDSAGGQLTLNPQFAGSAITADCTGCNTTGLTRGSSAGFTDAIPNITLINAAAGSQDIWRGYLTGVGVSQQIPAQQAADTYTLNLIVTIQ